MVAEMVDAVVLVTVPILVGELKLPLAFESCAVKMFPVKNVIVSVVKFTETLDPPQKGPEILEVEMPVSITS